MIQTLSLTLSVSQRPRSPVFGVDPPFIYHTPLNSPSVNGITMGFLVLDIEIVFFHSDGLKRPAQYIISKEVKLGIL